MGIFRFKKFSICDDRATMKVGTDAVLLGAWANVEGVKSVLDIGTGSGVIALIIAQRTHDDVMIDAIELLKADSQQAIENVALSPWPEKINILNTSLQDYQSEKKYDLIVCNPPYFTKSLLPPTRERTTVRHDTELTFDELVVSATELLSSDGNFCLILPPAEAEEFTAKAHAGKLFLNHKTSFFTREGKPQERALLKFARTSLTLKLDSLVLYSSADQWSEDYWNLTGDFYLKRS